MTTRYFAKRLQGSWQTGGIVAWHNGRAEIGPRTARAQSAQILRERRNLVRVNRVKGREVWRPLAPSVLKEFQHQYFEGACSPFMIVAAKVKHERQHEIPAVVHVDGSVRPQLVDRRLDGCFAQLLDAFHQLTGVPMLINTSLNRRGEPICYSPEDTIRFFIDSGIDALAMEGCIVRHE